MSLSDFTKIICMLGAIGVLILISWGLKRFFSFLPNYVPRKFLHVTAISVAALSFVVLESPYYLTVLGLLILLGNYLMVKRGLFEEEGKTNYGVFYVPVSYLLLVFFLNDHREIAAFSMLIMAFADGFAALIGEMFPVVPYRTGKSKKTLVGSLTFFAFSVSLFYLALILVPEAATFVRTLSMREILIYAIFFGAILTAVEAVSFNGLDNLFVPLISAILFLIFFTASEIVPYFQLLLALFLVFIIIIISAKAKFLTPDGIIAATIVGLIIFGLGGLKWSVPLLVFFFSSSILSKLKKVSNDTYEKGDARDASQVFANGALPSALLLFSFFGDGTLFYLLYLTSLAVSTADTWATEIGNLVYRKTYLITNFKEIEQGLSGGVSFVGSLAGLLGAAIIISAGLFWVDYSVCPFPGLAMVVGFLGMTIDSLLGALWQSKYKCAVCDKITEKTTHCGKPTVYYKGIKWLNNNWVNFISELISVLIFYFIYSTVQLW